MGNTVTLTTLHLIYIISYVWLDLFTYKSIKFSMGGTGLMIWHRQSLCFTLILSDSTRLLLGSSRRSPITGHTTAGSRVASGVIETVTGGAMLLMHANTSLDTPL